MTEPHALSPQHPHVSGRGDHGIAYTRDDSLPDFLLSRAIAARLGAAPGLRAHRYHLDLEVAQGAALEDAWKQMTRFVFSGATNLELLATDEVPGGLYEAAFDSGGGVVAHLAIDGGVLRALLYSRDVEAADRLIRRIEEFVAKLREASSQPDQRAMRFWSLDADGPRIDERGVRCPSWPEIRTNYTEGVAREIDWLTSLTEPTERGKLVLWHGPTGSGKSYAIRALARAWPAASIEVITDPEAFLDEPRYMNRVLLASSDKQERTAETGRARVAKVIVLEDVPDLVLHADGSDSGRHMSKLLNATDGLLGADLRTIFVATTHEPGNVQESALTRAGRCLQVLQFELFEPERAENWLESKGLAANVRKPIALADLYARVRAAAPHKRTKHEHIGFSNANRASTGCGETLEE